VASGYTAGLLGEGLGDRSEMMRGAAGRRGEISFDVRRHLRN